MNKAKISYKKSGVNIQLANKFVDHIATLTSKNVKNRNSKNKFKNIGSFGSLFDLSSYKIKDPVIVSSTDGVGTKLELANYFKKFDTIGIDLVAMCVNDLIVLGAKPLFFLDYIALGKINLKKLKKILTGIVSGCKQSDCELIGGETAEMPGTYEKNKFDLAGFSVGVISKKKILKKDNVKKGDIILALPSSGLHSNGYSLVRHILKRKRIPKSLSQELLKPTKIYVKEIQKLINKNLITAAAHITGGGISENLARSIPSNLSAEIDLAKIKPQKIFSWIKSKNINDLEMLRTFNCGVGFCIIVKKNCLNKIYKSIKGPYQPYKIGIINNSKKRINFINKIKW